MRFSDLIILLLCVGRISVRLCVLQREREKKREGERERGGAESECCASSFANSFAYYTITQIKHSSVTSQYNIPSSSCSSVCLVAVPLFLSVDYSI